MLNKIITCRNATMYVGMLTRGKQYQVIDIIEEKNCVKLVCDNGRTRLFNIDYFDLEGKTLPILINWELSDNIDEVDRDDFLTWVEVNLFFSDGTKRWCQLFTPELLSKILTLPDINPPGLYIPHIILVRSFDENDVEVFG